MARERGMSFVDILQHDLLPVCPLFERDLPAVATKSKLVSEISPFQRPYTSNWDKTCAEPSAIHVDFMSRVRRLPLHAYGTLGELVSAVLNSVAAFCHSEYIHMLLDSYIELSLKEPERRRRSHGDEGIDIVGMSENSPIPKQNELFLVSENNKRNLQKLL